MSTPTITQIILAGTAALLYIALLVGYELWLWKKGMHNFRKWLGEKLGYSIQVNIQAKSISWKIADSAPTTKKIWLMLISNTFFLLTGMFPILLLAIVILLVWWGNTFL